MIPAARERPAEGDLEYKRRVWSATKTIAREAKLNFKGKRERRIERECTL
jgi:hypothetical protein